MPNTKERKSAGSAIAECLASMGTRLLRRARAEILTTNDHALYQRAKSLRDHAMSKSAGIGTTELVTTIG